MAMTPQDKSVLEAVQRGGKPSQPKQVSEMRQKLIDLMAHYKVSPDAIRKLAKAGELVMKDKSLYPMFIQQAQQLKIPGVEQLGADFDPQKVAQIVSLARLLDTK
jgi:hypothetical protein